MQLSRIAAPYPMARAARSDLTLIFNFSLGSFESLWEHEALTLREGPQESTVIVCHCRRTTDREIRRAVREGATTLRDVSTRCGAGSGCGGCTEAVVEILSAELGSAMPRAVDVIRSSVLS